MQEHAVHVVSIVSPASGFKSLPARHGWKEETSVPSPFSSAKLERVRLPHCPTVRSPQHVGSDRSCALGLRSRNCSVAIFVLVKEARNFSSELRGFQEFAHSASVVEKLSA
jgi:hypothetical protein